MERDPLSEPVANPDEVAEWMWLTANDLLSHPKLLPSVPDFFKAWARGAFKLPAVAGEPDAVWRDL